MTRSIERRVTIYDVAQQAGVSKSLVSLVLQGSSKVSPAKREAVQAAMAELGYRPSRAASALAARRTDTIGVVIDEFSNQWYVELLTGLRTGLVDSGFHVSLADSELNAHLGESPVASFLAARVDGLVLAAEPSQDTEAGLSVPTVVVGNRHRTVAGADQIRADDWRGSRLAVDHLRGLGHRHLAFISGPTGPAVERADGFLAATLGLERSVVTAPDTTDRGGHAAVRALLADRPAVTAIVAANDLMAIGAWQALREAGLSVPDDVSLVGYDNSPLAALGLLQLTTVDARNAEAGRLAAVALRSRLDNPGQAQQVVTVEPRLVPRRTTSQPRTRA